MLIESDGEGPPARPSIAGGCALVLVLAACTATDDAASPFDDPMLGVVADSGDTTYETAETRLVLVPDDTGVTHWEGEVRLAVPASGEPEEFSPRSAEVFNADAQDWWYALDDGVEAKALVDDTGEMLGWLAVGPSRVALVLDVDGDGIVDYYEDSDVSLNKRYLLNDAGRRVATGIRTNDWSTDCRGGGAAFSAERRASLILACGTFSTAPASRGGASSSGATAAASDVSGITVPASSDVPSLLPTQDGPGDLQDLDVDLEIGPPPAHDRVCSGSAEEEPESSLSEEEQTEVEQFREDMENFGLDAVYFGAYITDVLPIEIPNPFDGDGTVSGALANLWEKIGDKLKDEAAQQDAFIRITSRSVEDFERLMLLHATDRLDQLFGENDPEQQCEERDRDHSTGRYGEPELSPLYEAKSKGEPHLHTFDGRRYSFQAAGEFVFMTSDGMDVQLRFEGTVGSATWTQATAVRAGDHVIESYYDQSSPRDVPSLADGLPVIIDGVERAVDYKGTELDGGAYVARLRGGVDDRQLLVMAADESAYVLVENLNMSQNVVLGLFEPAGSVSGLAGDADGDRSNDLALRDGTELSPAEARSVEGLYGTLATDWRVRPEERLFTRGSTEDFLTPAYTDLPEEQTGLADFPPAEVDQARSRCRMAGVSDAEAVESCAYDVLVGGGAWSRQAAASVTGQQPEQQLRSGQRTGDHPLFVAADRCRPGEVDEQLRGGVHADLARERDGWTALLFAAQGGCTEVVDELLAAGANVELTDDRGFTPLQVAASNGSTEVVRILLAAGADPNRFPPGRDGPMVAAAFRGYTEIVTALANAGAYVDITRERDEATPLLAATYEGHAEVVERLLELGADPALPDEGGYSPLMAAGSQGHADLVRHLISAGAPVEQRRFRDGTTALHFAASNGDAATVTALLDAGADPAVQDDRGRTPTDVADDRVADLLRP